MCIFCEIVKGNIPCKKIYENEYVLAFLDVSNDVIGHTLVVPKKHYENIIDCPLSLLLEVVKVVKKISKHYTENCCFTAVNILNASGASAQQSVFHLHFHILPRKEDDKLDAWPKFKPINRDLDSEQKILELK
ncbi:MAG: HIT domain-containing protein [Clostridia bacterium]